MNAPRLGTVCAAAIVAVVLATRAAAHGAADATPVLNLHAVFSADAKTSPLEITLFRWPTDGDRAPLLAALSTPPPQPVAAAAPAAGRGGRGGRGAAPPALSPMARLAAAIKAAPTCGYIWTGGVTGYSIKDAWRAPLDEGGERIVLVTDRRLGPHAAPSALPADRPAAATAAPESAAERDFTVIEMRLDDKRIGEGKTSLDANVIVDAAAKTLALDGYGSAPTLLRITR